MLVNNTGVAERGIANAGSKMSRLFLTFMISLRGELTEQVEIPDISRKAR
jgi:hypothetical protein